MQAIKLEAMSDPSMQEEPEKLNVRTVYNIQKMRGISTRYMLDIESPCTSRESYVHRIVTGCGRRLR